MPIYKRFFIIFGLAAALLIVSNLDFFRQNILYTFFAPAPPAYKAKKINNNTVMMQPNLLVVPGLGIEAPVVYVDENSEQVFQKALVGGVVHYPNTAKPGEFGNCYIFGHSSDYFWSQGKYKTVFALLPRVQKGAEIVVSNQSGEKFTYIVMDSFSAEATDVKWLGQGDYTKKILTLQTSWPIGTALKRWIVRAELRQAD